MSESLGPPDIVSDTLQPLDLVNSVSMPGVHHAAVNNHNQAGAAPQMPVDIVSSLPVNGGDCSPEGGGGGGGDSADTDDRIDARWFQRGSGTAQPSYGIPMPTEKDAQYYNMNHKKRGKAYIFNHMNFDPRLQLKARNGTNNDRDNLRTVLRQLDFEVEVYNDLAYRDIERVLESASLSDHAEEDCIMVFVLSHGELGILYASDQLYKPDKLWTHFSADKCPSLAGKPKLFFVQACQGDQLDHGVKMVARTETDGATVFKVPNHADFLIAYSTIPGFYSWRNTTAGSWFVQAFCHVLERGAHTTDLLSLMTRVSRRVAFDFQSNVPGDFVMHEKKQIPCITSMLTRDIVFTRK